MDKVDGDFDAVGEVHKGEHIPCDWEGIQDEIRKEKPLREISSVKKAVHEAHTENN